LAVSPEPEQDRCHVRNFIRPTSFLFIIINVVPTPIDTQKTYFFLLFLYTHYRCTASAFKGTTHYYHGFTPSHHFFPQSSSYPKRYLHLTHHHKYIL
jgi:hypothetical protein